MKFYFFAFVLPVFLIVSCTDSPLQTKPAQHKTENKTTVKNKPASTFSDTLKINFPAAVFYSPDSLQLEKIKAVTDARIFDGSMHEYFYLMRNAHIVIKNYYPKLKIIEAKNVRFLLFTGTDKKNNCIDLDTKNDAYGLFIFNMKKPPHLTDMADIESELSFYFSK